MNHAAALMSASNSHQKGFEFYSGYVMLPEPNATKPKLLTSSEAVKRLDVIPYQRVVELYQLGIKRRTLFLLLALREHANRYHAGQGR
jgi:hypothetical protein